MRKRIVEIEVLLELRRKRRHNGRVKGSLSRL